MGMKMGFHQEHRMEQSMRQEQRLGMTMEQRHAILMTQRLALIGAVADETYDPYGVCPKCGKKLTLEEILKGFRQDPTDPTTQCPNAECNNRFVAKLRNVSSTGGSTAEMPFFCPSQTIHQLTSLTEWEPERIAKEHQAVFRSAVAHFGSIFAAFQQGGIAYPWKQKEVDAWEDKIRPFLGQLPDTKIAAIIGCSRKKIGRERWALDIAPFRWSDHVDDA